MAERIHAMIKDNAPDLVPKLWYGMPAYAKDGKIVCFFQPAQKFKSRYATLGFNDDANLDDGTMWPTTSPDEADRRRREEDRRAGEEGGGLINTAHRWAGARFARAIFSSEELHPVDHVAGDSQ